MAWNRKDHEMLVGIYNQQFQGTIILMVFDLQGLPIFHNGTGIVTYIYHKNRHNVCKYTIHSLVDVRKQVSLCINGLLTGLYLIPASQRTLN